MDNKNIKVSVIIPVYKVEDYIEECVLSVTSQTLPEIEVICVNDGTPDNSMKIVERIAQGDNRIVIVNKENGGLSSARNAGLQRAAGEYVYFLDSDDYLIPEALEQLYCAAAEQDLDIVYFGAKTIYENSQVKKKFYRRFEGYYHREHSYEKGITGLQLLQAVTKNGEYRTSVCLQMIRRSFLLENHINFYEGILHEDNLFSLQSVLCAEKTSVLNEDFYIRRVRNESIMTSDGNVRSSWGYFVALKEMLKFLQDRAFNEEEFRCIREILAVMQRDAVLAIKGMAKVEMEENFPKQACAQDKLLYDMFVQNVIKIGKQGSLRYKVFNRVQKVIGK